MWILPEGAIPPVPIRLHFVMITFGQRRPLRFISHHFQVHVTEERVALLLYVLVSCLKLP
jgi:hypothetical protein